MLKLIFIYSLIINYNYIIAQDREEGEEAEDEEPLECNFCVHSRKKKDLELGLNQEPDCMNHLKFLSRTDLRRTCAKNEKFCKSTVTNLNGFFVEIDRNCAEECDQGCEQHGYGLFHTECTRCCQEPLCNEYDGKEYYQPLASNHHFNLWPLILSALLFYALNCP